MLDASRPLMTSSKELEMDSEEENFKDLFERDKQFPTNEVKLNLQQIEDEAEVKTETSRKCSKHLHVSINDFLCSRICIKILNAFARLWRGLLRIYCFS